MRIKIRLSDHEGRPREAYARISSDDHDINLVFVAKGVVIEDVRRLSKKIWATKTIKRKRTRKDTP